MNTQDKIIYLQKRFNIDEETAHRKVDIMSRYSALMADSAIDVISLAKRIKPLVRVNPNGDICYFGGPDGNPGSELYWSNQVDIIEASFNYAPVPIALDSFALRKVLEITTYHRSSCRPFPNPTAEEVLRQMPEDLSNRVVGFEIYIPYDKIAESYDEILKLNRFQTIFYAGKLPAHIAQQTIIAGGKLY